MTASLIISIIALILCATICVSVTVLVSRALAASFRTLDQMHARSGEQMSQLLDRFQAIKWEDLAALRSTQDNDDETGFFAPSEPEDEELGVIEPGMWGSLRRSREGARLSDEAQAILDEDFDAAGDPR